MIKKGKTGRGNISGMAGVTSLCTILLASFIFSSCSRGAATGKGSGKGADEPGQPNIMVILADDIGYSDIGAYGSEIRTPNLDRLAAEGVRFTHFYNTARCSPSRASLLTGLYPHQAAMGHLATRPLWDEPGYLDDLNRSTLTIAEVLRGAGYSTYMTGKWHLGSTTNFGSIPGSTGVARDPRVRGFDSYWGYTEGHSQDTFQGNYHLLSNDVPERSYTTSSGNGQPGNPVLAVLRPDVCGPLARPRVAPPPFFLAPAISVPRSCGEIVAMRAKA